MKKITIIIMAIIYLLLSIGIKVNTHYCGNMISSVDFFFDSKHCCGKEGLTKKCCRDHISYYKLSDKQESHPILIFAASDFTEVLIPGIDYLKTFLLSEQESPVLSFIFFDSDPPLRKNPVYIINRSLRV